MAKKFMQAVAKRIASKGTKGALHEELGISKDKPIPTERINSELAQLHKESAGEKKLSASELKKERRLAFAKAARK